MIELTTEPDTNTHMSKTEGKNPKKKYTEENNGIIRGFDSF